MRGRIRTFASSTAMNTNADAVRFMILGSARTGSNLLVSLLSAHPNIKIYGELLNLDWLGKEDLREALEDPIRFLQKRVYEAHRPEIAAVGFKMFYEHLTRSYFEKPLNLPGVSAQLRARWTQFSSFIESNYEWEALNERFRKTWEFLYGDRSLSVIHLKRRNMLHTLISIRRAFMTSQWWCLKSSSGVAPTLHLHPDECCRYFHMLDTRAQEADTAFQGHPKLEVSYEALAERQDDTMEEIFAFLKVPYAPVTTRMKKQNLTPPCEAVANYDQLKNYFRDTKWNVFFE
jgi:LPS sulfotransferase NodH